MSSLPLRDIPDSIPKHIQTSLWESLCGSWVDERSAQEIIDDIYNSRTMGREFSW